MFSSSLCHQCPVSGSGKVAGIPSATSPNELKKKNALETLHSATQLVPITKYNLMTLREVGIMPLVNFSDEHKKVTFSFPSNRNRLCF